MSYPVYINKIRFLSTGGHDPVTCLDVNEDNTVLASGSEDGVLKFTHIGNGKVNTGLQTTCNKVVVKPISATLLVLSCCD